MFAVVLTERSIVKSVGLSDTHKNAVELGKLWCDEIGIAHTQLDDGNIAVDGSERIASVQIIEVSNKFV